MNCSLRIMLMCVGVSVASCSMLQPVPLDSGRSPPAAVEVGDQVKLSLRDGSVLEGRVAQRTADGLAMVLSKDHVARGVTWDQVLSMEREEYSGKRTARNVGIGIGVAFLIVSFGGMSFDVM